MKKAINAWSVPGQVPFEELFARLSSAGFEGVELNLDGEGASAHSLGMATGKEALARVRALSEQYCLPVCSVSTSLYGDSLGSADPKERERGKAVLRKQLDCAAALGADGILVVPGGIGPERSIAAAHETARRTLLDLAPEIADRRIYVGLENVWNGFFASPRDMADFIDGIACPFVAAYFDVGNVAYNAYPEYWIEILGRRIVKVHVKDFLHGGGGYRGAFVNLLQGDIRWDRVTPALRAAGYDGYVTAELAEMPKTPEYLYSTTSAALDIILNY